MSRLIENECQLGDHVDLGRDIEEDINKRYETFESDHSDIIKRISLRLKELEDSRSETMSRTTAKSSRNGSTRSSQHSRHSIRSETASKAAELKTKLKYLDAEASAKLHLDKIRTMRDLDIAEAKLDIIDGTEDLASELDEARKTLPKADVLGPFLESTVKFEGKPSAIDYSQDIPRTREFALMDKVVSQGTTPYTTNITSVSVHLPVKTTANRESINKTSMSAPLNPKASEFVSQQPRPTNFPLQNTSDPATVNCHYPVENSASGQTQSLTPTISCKVSSKDNYDSSATTINDLAKSFADQVNLSRLPPPEPTVFDGDPLKYQSWKAAFSTLIDQKHIPSSERDVIENFFLLPSENAYTEAKILLDQRYGDSFVIANAFRDKLEKWPKISSRDSKALLRFSDFLKQCEIAMENTLKKKSRQLD